MSRTNVVAVVDSTGANTTDRVFGSEPDTWKLVCTCTGPIARAMRCMPPPNSRMSTSAGHTVPPPVDHLPVPEILYVVAPSGGSPYTLYSVFACASDFTFDSPAS